MKHPYLFLDFDRTLFDTDHFIEAVWYAVANHYQVVAEEALAELRDWYEYSGDLRTYRFDSHVKHLTNRPVDEVAAAIHGELEQDDYVYEDAECVNDLRSAYDVHILTFGEPWWQGFKTTYAPQFSDIPNDIILEPKNAFLRQRFAHTSGWLVDDVIDGHLPEGYKQVWVRRQEEVPIVRLPNGIMAVNSLNHLKEALES